jgi:Tol biopolymer transport system component
MKKLWLFLIIGVSVILLLLVIAMLSDDKNAPDNNQNNNPLELDEIQDSSLGTYPGCDIVFTSDLHSVGIGEQGSELYCIKKDGSNKKRITNNNYFEFHADVSPVRQEIVTVTLFEEGSDKNGELDTNSELIIWDFNGNIVKRLTNNNRPESVPHWSPDGEKVTFFAGNTIGKLNIYTINRGGTNEQKLTSGGVDVDPSFSPDGEIIFSRGKKIMIMNEDGSNLKTLAELEIDPEDPIFIDPNTIAFETKISNVGNYGLGDYDIYLINKDGTNLRDISQNNFVDALPQPIGNKITFWRIQEGKQGTQIVVMDFDGTNQQELPIQLSNNQMPTGNQ